MVGGITNLGGSVGGVPHLGSERVDARVSCTSTTCEAEVLENMTKPRYEAQLFVTTIEAPLAFFLIDSMPFKQASFDL